MKNIATFNTIVAEAMDELNGVWEREEQEQRYLEATYYELDSKYDGIEAEPYYDVANYTYDEIKAMGRDERNAVRKACEKHLDFVGDDWDYYYGIYTTVCAVEDDEFRAENEDKVRAIFKKDFEGKTIDEIRNDPELYDRWGYYSDYHKDCFGYRPHGVVCGEYINPWDR